VSGGGKIPGGMEPEGVLAGAFPEEKLAWAAALGVPAFVRRANALEEALTTLHDRIRTERWRRLRYLHAAARDLEASRRAGTALPPGIAAALEEITGVGTRFRPGPPANVALSPRRSAMLARRLRRRIVEFNARWSAYLAAVSLEQVRSLQSGYNRWYPLEREFALRGVRMSFTPVRLLEREDLIRMHPGLPVADEEVP
jgi:hypothetical protein